MRVELNAGASVPVSDFAGTPGWESEASTDTSFGVHFAVTGGHIGYWLSSEGDGPGRRRATIDILDVDRASMRTMDDTTTPGLNRIVWDLRREGEDGPGSEVLAGIYTVRVTLGDEVSTGEITVIEDTREQVPVVRRIAKLQAFERARDMTTSLREAPQRVERAIRTSATVVESLVGRSGAEALREGGAELQATLQSLKERLFTGPRCQGICGRSKLPSNVVRRPLQVLGGSPDEPTANERLMLAQAEQALESILEEVNRIFNDQVSSYSRRLQEAGHSPFSEADPRTLPLEAR